MKISTTLLSILDNRRLKAQLLAMIKILMKDRLLFIKIHINFNASVKMNIVVTIKLLFNHVNIVMEAYTIRISDYAKIVIRVSKNTLVLKKVKIVLLVKKKLL